MSDGPVVVTGASGFLGRHVLHALGMRGRPVIALIRDLDAWHRLDWTASLDHVTPVVGEKAVPEGIGGIVHLAALVRHSRANAAEVYDANVEGTLEMVRLAALNGCRIVYASTSGVVGCFRTPGRVADEDSPYALAEIRRWPYYHSKAVAEQRARELAAGLHVQLVVVRPPVLLGPGDHRFRSTGTLIRFLQGRLPFLVNGGMHFADVRDVAEAIVRALQHPQPRPLYHLTGKVCSIREFFALAEQESGVRAPRHILPFRLAWTAAAVLRPLRVLPDPVVVEMASHYWGTISRYAEHDLGYRSRDPRETMRDTIEWIRGRVPLLIAD